jgi:hypothetical protein
MRQIEDVMQDLPIGRSRRELEARERVRVLVLRLVEQIRADALPEVLVTMMRGDGTEGGQK